MCKTLVQIGYGGWRRFSKKRQDVRFSLSQLLLAQFIHV